MIALLLPLALFWLFIPGLLIAYSLRMRGAALIATAPIATLVVFATIGTISTFIPTPDVRISALIVVAIAAPLLWLIAQRLDLPVVNPPIHTDRWYRLSATLSAVVGGIFASINLGRAIAPLGITPAFWDLQFHANLAQWMSQTHHYSPLHVASFAGNRPLQASGFYPNLFNMLVNATSLGDIMAALNAVTVVHVGLFTAGMVILSSAILRRYWWMPPLMALASLDMISFSAELHSVGGRWAFGFGFAMVPWFLATGAYLWRHVRQHPQPAPIGVQVALPLVTGFMGLCVAHAGAAYLALFVAAPAAIAGAFIKTNSRTERIACGAGGVIAVAGILAIWLFSRTGIGAISYPPLDDAYSATLEALSNGTMSKWYKSVDRIGSYSVLFLSSIGILGCLFKPRRRWVLVAFVATTALFVASVTSGTPWFSLIHPLYNDRTRTAAALALTTPLLACAGAEGIFDYFRQYLPPKPARVVTVGLPVACLTIALFAGGFIRSASRYEIVHQHARPAGHELVTEDEVAMMRSFAQSHPGAKIVGHPATGAPLYYAATGNPALPRYTSINANRDELNLLYSIGNIGPGTKACKIAKKLGIDYFYYDSELYRHGEIGSTKVYQGLVDLGKRMNTVQPVASAKTARIYKLPCDR